MDHQHLPVPPGRDSHEAIAALLATARLRISHGNPSSALQAVITALQLSGGNGAVLQTLARARDTYQSRMRASADANELATLFAECAIREADATAPVGSSSQPVDEMLDDAFQSTGIDTRACSTGGGAPILAESGRLQVVLDASVDGSSFICLQCGGLVSNMRKDEHYAYWCSYSQST